MSHILKNETPLSDGNDFTIYKMSANTVHCFIYQVSVHTGLSAIKHPLSTIWKSINIIIKVTTLDSKVT